MGMKATVSARLWTFMVYMAGDNNLDPNGAKDLIEMKRVGSTPHVNIVAQFDRSRGRGSKRYFLRKGGVARSDVVGEQGQLNSGDPKNLVDFIRWAVKAYPARHYALVLWNHGQGWDDTDVYAEERHRSLRRLARGRVQKAFFHTPVRRLLERSRNSPTARAILLDDGAKDFLDTQELKQALLKARRMVGRKLDVIGMDACLMSMAEIGYQLRGVAHYTVGSEETEPVEGWPYDKVLRVLTRKPTMDPRELAVVVPKLYVRSFGQDSQVTQSTFALGESESVRGAMVALVSALIRALTSDTLLQRLLLARAKVQSFDEGDNVDLIDYCHLLEAGLPRTPIAKAAQGVRKAIAGFVVASEAAGEDLRNARGAAIYFPTRAVSPLYRVLDFARGTGWNRFLELYLTAVRAR